jgi:hypothetical protein
MDVNTKNREELLQLVTVARGFRDARQIAFDQMQKSPFFEPWYQEAESTYRRFCEQIGLNPEPVFDVKAHEAKRVAEDHPFYVDAPKPRRDPAPEAGPWVLYGHVYGHADLYAVWHNGVVYQMTDGREPTNQAGYRNLQAMLNLKDLTMDDLVTVELELTPGP